MSYSDYPVEDLTVDDIWNSDQWAAMPYKLLWLRFPEGTSIFLESSDIAYFGAQLLADRPGGASPLMHLVEQIVPAILHKPAILMEIAQQMPFEIVRALTYRATWRSPAIEVADMLESVEYCLWAQDGRVIAMQDATEDSPEH